MSAFSPPNDKLVDLGSGRAYHYTAPVSPTTVKVCIEASDPILLSLMVQHHLISHLHTVHNLLIRAKTGQMIMGNTHIEIIDIVSISNVSTNNVSSSLLPASSYTLQLLRSPLCLHLYPFLHIYIISSHPYADYVKQHRAQITAFLNEIHYDEKTGEKDKTDKYTSSNANVGGTNPLLTASSSSSGNVSELMIILLVHADPSKDAKNEKKLLTSMTKDFGKDNVITISMPEEWFQEYRSNIITIQQQQQQQPQTDNQNQISSSSSSLSLSFASNQSISSSIQSQFLPSLKSKLMSSFHGRCSIYEMDLRKSLSTSSLLGWNYSRFLCVKESYALMMLMMNIDSESLRMYDELTAMMEEKMVKSSMDHTLLKETLLAESIDVSSSSSSSSILTATCLAPLFDLTSKDYPHLIYTSNLPLTDLHRYLFARVSVILFKEQRYEEVLQRGIALIQKIFVQIDSETDKLNHELIESKISDNRHLLLIIEKWCWLIGCCVDLYQRCETEIKAHQAALIQTAHADHDEQNVAGLDSSSSSVSSLSISAKQDEIKTGSDTTQIKPTLRREDSRSLSFFRSTSPERKTATSTSTSISTNTNTNSNITSSNSGAVEEKKEKERRSKKMKELHEQQLEHQRQLTLLSASRLSLFFTIINRLQQWVQQQNKQKDQVIDQQNQQYNDPTVEYWSYSSHRAYQKFLHQQQQERLALYQQWSHNQHHQPQAESSTSSPPFILNLHLDPSPHNNSSHLSSYISRYEHLQYSLLHPSLSPLLLHALLYFTFPTLSLSSLHALHYSNLYAQTFTILLLPSLASTIYHYLGSLYLHHRWYILAQHSIVMRMIAEIDRQRWDSVAETLLMMLGVTQQKFIKVKSREVKRAAMHINILDAQISTIEHNHLYPCCLPTSATIDSSSLPSITTPFLLSFLRHIFTVHLPTYTCIPSSTPSSSSGSASSTPPHILAMSNTSTATPTDLFTIVSTLAAAQSNVPNTTTTMPSSSSSLSTLSSSSLGVSVPQSPTVQRPTIPSPSTLYSMLTQPVIPSYLLHTNNADIDHVGVIFFGSLNQFITISALNMYFYIDTSPLHLVIELTCSSTVMGDTVFDDLVFALLREKSIGSNELIRLEYQHVHLYTQMTIYFHAFFVSIAPILSSTSSSSSALPSPSSLPQHHYCCVLSYDEDDDNNIYESLIGVHTPIFSLNDLWFHWSRLHLFPANRDELNDLIIMKILNQQDQQQQKERIDVLKRGELYDDDHDEDNDNGLPHIDEPNPHFLVHLDQPSITRISTIESGATSFRSASPSTSSSLSSSVTLQLLSSNSLFLIGKQQPEILFILIQTRAPLQHATLSILGVHLMKVTQILAVMESVQGDVQRRDDLTCDVMNSQIILPSISTAYRLIIGVPLAPLSHPLDDKQKNLLQSPLSRRSPPPIRIGTSHHLSSQTTAINNHFITPKRDHNTLTTSTFTLPITLILCCHLEAPNNHINTAIDSLTQSSPITYHLPLSVQSRLMQLGNRLFLSIILSSLLPSHALMELVSYSLQLPSCLSLDTDHERVNEHCLGMKLRGVDKISMCFELQAADNDHDSDSNINNRSVDNNNSASHKPQQLQSGSGAGDNTNNNSNSEGVLILSLADHSMDSTPSFLSLSFPISLSISSHDADIHLILSIPSTSVLGVPIPLSITVMYKAHHYYFEESSSITLLLSLLPSPYFYYSGNSSAMFTLTASNNITDKHTINIMLYPLIPGQADIPTFTLQQERPRQRQRQSNAQGTTRRSQSKGYNNNDNNNNNNNNNNNRTGGRYSPFPVDSMPNIDAAGVMNMNTSTSSDDSGSDSDREDDVFPSNNITVNRWELVSERRIKRHYSLNQTILVRSVGLVHTKLTSLMLQQEDIEDLMTSTS